jgi:hypothetical protein
MGSGMISSTLPSAVGTELVEGTRLEFVTSGIKEVDELVGGLPRGRITEVFGPVSSGRTGFLMTVLAQASIHQEAWAIIDAFDCLDPVSVYNRGISTEGLLWVQCSSDVGRALKVTDLLLCSGGFGLVVLDIGDAPAEFIKRIPQSWWFRFRRSIEKTPTCLIIIGQEPCAKSCASLVLKMNKDASVWLLPIREFNTKRMTHANLIQGVCSKIERYRPVRPGRNHSSVRFTV